MTTTTITHYHVTNEQKAINEAIRGVVELGICPLDVDAPAPDEALALKRLVAAIVNAHLAEYERSEPYDLATITV